MSPSLNQLYLTLEEQRQALLNCIQNRSEQELAHHSMGKWSIAQVLSHLIASEQLSVNYLNKKILGIKEAPNTGLIEELKMLVLIISQRIPFIKFTAPKKVVEKTTPYQTAEEIQEAWEKARSELKEVLTHFQDDQLKRKVFKHPIVGMINIEQALRFLQEHIIHHTPQIKKLLK